MSDPLASYMIKEMMRGDLEHGYDLIENEDFDLAIHHFEQAIEKAKQLKTLSQQPKQLPENNQPTLDV